MFYLAVDPGDKHVGVAWWDPDYPDRHARQWEADEALDAIEGLMQSAFGSKVLIIEEWRLYANAAMSQIHSEMLTSEMIGALKWMAKKMNFGVVMQGALIKKPTRRQMPARGIQSVATGVHAKDAELHLMHYLLKEGKWPGN